MGGTHISDQGHYSGDADMERRSWEKDRSVLPGRAIQTVGRSIWERSSVLPGRWKKGIVIRRRNPTRHRSEMHGCRVASGSSRFAVTMRNSLVRPRGWSGQTDGPSREFGRRFLVGAVAQHRARSQRDARCPVRSCLAASRAFPTQRSSRLRGRLSSHPPKVRSLA